MAHECCIRSADLGEQSERHYRARLFGDQWSSIIETTSGVTQTQRAAFTITGGAGLASKTVHVWASNFSFSTGGPSQWFIRQPDITPAGCGVPGPIRLAWAPVRGGIDYPAAVRFPAQD